MVDDCIDDEGTIETQTPVIIEFQKGVQTTECILNPALNGNQADIRVCYGASKSRKSVYIKYIPK